MTFQLQEEEVKHNLSARGWANVAGIMPKIKGAVAERMSETRTNIDLSTAENWLIRPELVEICREAMVGQLRPKVRTRADIYATTDIDSTFHTPMDFSASLPFLMRVPVF